MKEYDLEELKASIKKVGFVQVDKIVVRPIAKQKNEFVVLEGNRRVAALKSLVRENKYGETQIDSAVLNTILNFKVFVYMGDNPDIAWIIQGIRHISGVKSWQPYQQALTLYKMTYRGETIKDAAQTLGIPSTTASRLIRSMFGFQHAKNESDYSGELKPVHFAYFYEVIFKQPVLQKYLEWNEKDKKFVNIPNLNKLFSWVFPEQGKDAKITQAMQLRDDIVPVMINQPLLFELWANDETMTVQKLNREIGKMEQKQAVVNVTEWLRTINTFNESMTALPLLQITDSKQEFIEKLEKTKDICDKHIEILNRI
ncbi:MAG: ParB N-terminal domain-containing protein [Nitrososphaerota archaeon]|jgi:hypothetical protein|nr:ParB N-terminal domain-containing protein [Nitrososphaerota archaeon]